jgi:ABC-type dipeptide/oligopeptide/nickel transport system permease component
MMVMMMITIYDGAILTFAVFDQGGRGEHVVDGVGGRDLLLLQVQVLIDVAAKLALPLLPRLGVFVA